MNKKSPSVVFVVYGKRLQELLKFFPFVFLFFLLLFSCSEEPEPIQPVFDFDSIMDVDSNYYQTVKVGNLWWMAEDLRTKKFRDGSLIQDGQDELKWLSDKPSYCIYNNDNSAPGLLYNWNAVSDLRNIAPEGWHVATDEEWKLLEISLGMSLEEVNLSGWRGTDEASKLKREDRKGWNVEPETWPNNSSGFSAMAGGARLFNGKFADPGLFNVGFWWTSTPAGSGKSFYRHLDHKTNKIFRDSTLFSSGFSVRCVKNY